MVSAPSTQRTLADLQVKHADAIKTLDAQAQGEALLRKALAELKMWGLQREFALTDTAQQAAAQGAQVWLEGCSAPSPLPSAPAALQEKRVAG